MSANRNAPSESDTAAMAALIVRHHGVVSEIAKELSKGDESITRQAISRRIARLGLKGQADRARAAAGVRGPRSTLAAGVADPREERERLMDALKLAANCTEAAAAAGMSRRNFFRRLAHHKIDHAKVLRARKRGTRKRS